MISLYIQTNLLIAASWIVFQLLPKGRFRYRASKTIAQTLLLSSLVAMPALILLPDISFPNLSSPPEVSMGREVDSGSEPASPMQQVLGRAVSVAETAPEAISFLPSVWLWIFFAGVLAMVVRLQLSGYRMSKLLRDTQMLHRLGRTSVVVSDAIAVPFSVLNWGRAYVVLPSALVPYRDDFRIALRHEIEHHRRRDTFWALLLEWLVCGFYLNPAVYLWRNSILQLQELACDEALIGRMGISKQAYGSCLLRVAEMALGRRFMCRGTTCMIPSSESNSHSFLKRRIIMFAQHERSTAKKAASVALGTLSCFIIVAGAYVAQAAVRSGGSADPLVAQVFDSRIQPLAEEALKKGMALHGASAGFAIVSDPVRGTIIAAVSLNAGFDKKLKGDWALSYPLEPGSIIKPLIAASALQHKATKLEEMHDCGNGEYLFGKNLYHDVESFVQLSTADAVVHSSNICTIKIAQKLGAKGLESGLREFGLGHVPVVGVVPDDVYLGFLSHGIGNRTDFYVTPIEMVQAYGAIANGGRLMKVIGADGKQSSEMVRDVLSSEVAGQMRATLRRVVEEGTAVRIKGSSIALAGKTSTVVKNGNQRVTGFIGYAPADRPKLVVYVALFDPKGPGKVGSNTAAPVFREIVERVVPVFNP